MHAHSRFETNKTKKNCNNLHCAVFINDKTPKGKNAYREGFITPIIFRKDQ